MQKARTALLGILCVIFCATCLVLLSMVFTMRQDIAALQASVDTLSDQMESQNAYVQNSISEMGNQLAQNLAEQSSLFSRVEAQLSYQSGKLVLTASVLPKEVVEGTTYLLTLADTSQSAEMISDGQSWSASLQLEPASAFTPVVVERRATGARQESLDTLYPDNILAVRGESIWSWDTLHASQDEQALYVVLTPSADGPVSGAADVAALVLTVTDDNGVILEERDMELQEAPQSDTRLWYRADLSDYLEQPSCSIHLYTTLKTTSGLSLADSNESASFAQTEASSSSGTGVISFSPRW
ncbi:hypothetical protein [Pseudoflavonifractor phocaeensis]|uniref:hypothetical protein n=1 Tax=Pseudoflavonifractor phocaeensis TaxID=1870988 RepID=UPI00195EAF5B|nr:hypothetical protein [Pseudoflavonifractor phocaeensis]MBM6871126.1 hypothetical protein [Pseudoflavonifractor phocaeensis]